MAAAEPAKGTRPSVRQETRGSCSPAVADVHGHVTITCQGADLSTLRRELAKIARDIEGLQKRKLSDQEILRQLAESLRRGVPLTSEEVSTLRAQGFLYAAKARGGVGPGAMSAYKPELQPVATRLWGDPRFEEQVPRETALIYRLYAAALLLSRGDDPRSVIQDALPWLRKALAVDEGIKDYRELRQAERFLTGLAEGRVKQEKVETVLMHQFRVAMPEASADDVMARVREAVAMLLPLMKPSEDWRYLSEQRLGELTVGQIMETLRLSLKGQFPGKDVGGQPMFAPLPNGNTKVTYTFNGNTVLSVEWEVNKAKQEIIPLNQAARDIMTLQGKGLDSVKP